jgi:hypothetical protein
MVRQLRSRALIALLSVLVFSIFAAGSARAAAGFGRPFSTITSDFGPRDLGGAAGSYFHRGTDFSARFGTTLRAVEAGRIATIAYQQGGAGLYFWIRSSDADRTVEYMHTFEDEGLPALALDKVYATGATGAGDAAYVKVTRLTVNGVGVYAVVFLDANRNPLKALASVSGVAVPGTTIRTRDAVAAGELIGVTGNTGAGPAHFHLGTYVASKGTGGRYNPMTHVDRSSLAAYPVTLVIAPQSGTTLNELIRISATASSGHRFDLDGFNFYVGDSLVWSARFGGFLGGAPAPANIAEKPATSTANGAHAIGGAGTDRFIANIALPAGIGNGPVPVRVEAVSCRGDFFSSSTTFLLAGGAGIEGAVKTPDGKPVSGASVTIMPGGWKLTAGVDGAFRAANITSGAYTVAAAKAGYKGAASITVNPRSGAAAARADLVLAPTGGVVAGTVKKKGTAAPIPLANISIARSDATESATARGDSFRFELLPPGVYTLAATAENFKRATRTVTILEGRTRTVNFSLVEIPFPSIVATARKYNSRGDVTFAQGVTVGITGPVAKTAPTGWGETAGKAKFYDLPPGTYSVSWNGWTASATVVPGQTAYLDLGP